MKPLRVVGIMSGTSVDGIDVAILDMAPRGSRAKPSGLRAKQGPRPNLVAHGSVAYPRRVRDAVLAVSNAHTHTAEIARLHFLLPELYAAAVLDVARKAGVDPQSLSLAGCHGQTVFHDGAGQRYLGRHVASTLQIGDGAVLAERLRIPVVSDFRIQDIAAGGRGAPLVPFVDYMLLRDRRIGRVALNLGGIGNITAIPAGAAPDSVIAFDTGPANMVMDQLAAIASGGRLTFDRGGRMAASGRLNQPLLERLLKDRYFSTPPPKSAGREQYGAEFVQQLMATGLPVADLMATAAAFSAAAVAAGIERFVRPAMLVEELVAAGGGVQNPVLMSYLAGFLPGVRIRTIEEFGIPSDAKEAVAFAILAAESFSRRPANLPAATGASRPVVLGKVSWP
jgi:anhydro-N-acetylmuramic acid kinase